MKQVAVVPTMGTTVSIDVRTPTQAEIFGRAVETVTARLRDIDDVFSAWRADSWVSRLIGRRVALNGCPAEVQHVMELAVDLERRTDGYFSPFWRSPYGDAGPDPTGLVKGWAAQQASDVLVALGLPDHAVNAAGDVVLSGRPDPAEPDARWRVGISDPHRSQALVGVVELDQSAARWAVATSGAAERGAHVRDPHTGASPISIASATAVTSLDTFEEGGAVADAYATALVAAGGRAPALLERSAAAGVGALLVADDGSVRDPLRLLVSHCGL